MRPRLAACSRLVACFRFRQLNALQCGGNEISRQARCLLSAQSARALLPTEPVGLSAGGAKSDANFHNLQLTCPSGSVVASSEQVCSCQAACQLVVCSRFFGFSLEILQTGAAQLGSIQENCSLVSSWPLAQKAHQTRLLLYCSVSIAARSSPPFEPIKPASAAGASGNKQSRPE